MATVNAEAVEQVIAAFKTTLEAAFVAIRRFQAEGVVWGTYNNVDSESIHDMPLWHLLTRVPPEHMVAVSDALLECRHCRPVLRQLLAELADHHEDETTRVAIQRAIEVLSSTHETNE